MRIVNFKNTTQGWKEFRDARPGWMSESSSFNSSLIFDPKVP